MEETQVTPLTPQRGPSFVLPPHSNKMAWSIICTLFCCLVGGIDVIIFVVLMALGVFAEIVDL